MESFIYVTRIGVSHKNVSDTSSRFSLTSSKTQMNFTGDFDAHFFLFLNSLKNSDFAGGPIYVWTRPRHTANGTHPAECRILENPSSVPKFIKEYTGSTQKILMIQMLGKTIEV
jgi:hypothetical protein